MLTIKDIFRLHFKSLLKVFLFSITLMFTYEFIKEYYFPRFSKWESHTITIIFSSIVALIASLILMRKIEGLRQETLHELEEKKSIEIKLKETYSKLEKLVDERTIDLKETNSKLVKEIDSKKRVEELLQENERRYRILFQRSPVGIFQYDSDLFITDFNDYFIQLLRLSFDLIKHYDISKIQDPRIINSIKVVLEGRNGYYEGKYEISASNSIIYIILRTTPWFDVNNKIIGGIGIITDITAQKLFEKSLKEEKEKAEKSEKLKSEFLAQISHEIRTPINSLLNFASIIKEYTDRDDEDLLIAYNIMNNAGDRIVRTIDLILNMAEIQAGSFEIIKSRFDLFEEVLYKLYQQFVFVAKSKNIELRMNKNISDTLIYADIYTVTQIFDNLINNAIKYTEKGKVEISLFTKNGNNSISVEVLDSGIGISEEYLPYLFSPFSQEQQGYTRKYEGNGLGLALVKKYCEFNNAEITVKSSKEVGSSFCITFSNN